MPSPRIVTPEFCYLTGLSDSLRLQVTSSRIYDFGQETIEEDGIIINASFPAENYHHRNRYDIHDCDDCYLGIGRFTQYYTYHRESNGYPDIANGYRGPMYLCGEAALLSFFFDFFEKEWNLLIWPDAKLRYVPIYEDEKDILREIAQTANKNVESIENTTFEEAYKQFWEGKGNSSSDLQHIQNLKKDLPDWFLKKSIFDYEQRTIEKWVNESYPQSQQEYRKNLCDFINSVVQALKQTCNYLSDGFYYKESNDINDTPYCATMTMHDSKGPVTWIAKRHVTSASTASFREKSHHHFVWFDNYAEAKEYCDAHTCK